MPRLIPVAVTLRDIHDAVAGLGNPDYPLLDPKYSPGSSMPVVDFSPIVKQLLLKDDWGTLHELLTELGHGSDVADAIIKTFRSFQLDCYIDGADEIIAELKGITILTYRIPSSGHPDNNYWLLTNLYQNTLSCSPATIRDSAKPALLKRLITDVEKQRFETKRTDLAIPTLSDLERLENDWFTSDLSCRLAAIPVTSRAVIFDAIERGWGHSTIKLLRPELYYGERLFGNNAEWNRHYVDWTHIFIAPPADSDISKLLTKAAIREIGEMHNIPIPKSYSRSRMLDRIRTSDSNAYARLFRIATKDSAIVAPSSEADLNRILARRKSIEYACRALAAI